MSAWFRAAFVLMAIGRYGYGDHVTDPQAYVLRVRRVFGRRAS